MNLYPYQQTGVDFLASRKRALLADEMGLGKTAQAVAACKAFAIVPLIGVVCPASVRENWRREFARFWPEDAFVLMVESYDKIARGAWAMAEFDVLILDEAHYLKTRDTKRTKAIFDTGGLVGRADKVILLTGTPMPNHPAELWPMLRACAPETITGKSGKPDSYWQFVNRHCKTRDNGFGLQIVGGKNLDQLAEKLKPFMLRRTKAEVLPDLPEIRFDELFVEGEMPPPASVAEEIQHKLVRVTLEQKGVAGLREIAPHVATLRRITGLAKVASAVAWVKDWFESGGGKLVLMAYHTEVLKGLADGLDKFARCAVVTGATVDRQAQVDRFQNNSGCHVFIGQIQAAGIGINLTAASDMLFVESSWVPAENQQAAMRIHRIGQKNACLVRFATLAGSIDEQIQRAVVRKTRDIDALFAAGHVESV